MWEKSLIAILPIGYDKVRITAFAISGTSQSSTASQERIDTVVALPRIGLK